MSKITYIGMSGGVDSSVAAYLLKEEGSEVRGVYANCFYEDDECRNNQDHIDTVKVSGSLNIKLDTKDYREEYHDKVLRYFYDEYSNGRTPNPDILCNSEIKFGAMADDIFGNESTACLATGHYVANRSLAKEELVSVLSIGEKKLPLIEDTITLLYKDSKDRLNFLFSGVDDTKDQSYFLYKLYDKPKNLSRYVFPLGELTKVKVRALAKSLKLDVATKPDSQGICFIGNIKLKDFIKNHIKASKGNVINNKNEIIGSHSGVQFYTIGQRHGFILNSYSGDPLYVVKKVVDKNQLVVGERDRAYTKRFTISELSFPYNIENFLEKFNEVGLSVRIRNLGVKIPCTVAHISVVKKSSLRQSASTSKKFEVQLSIPEFGVSTGQSAVFYINRLMLGGGIIESVNV